MATVTDDATHDATNMQAIFPNMQCGQAELFDAPKTTISADETPDGQLVLFRGRQAPVRLLAVWVAVGNNYRGAFRADFAIQGVSVPGDPSDFGSVPDRTLVELANGHLWDSIVTGGFQCGHLFYGGLKVPRVSLYGVTLSLAPIKS
ncbi:MAG TPA: hypothetical protein VGH44_04525 [Candidatus Saccharimonadia bacterium]|jgi:hypothetical protein